MGAEKDKYLHFRSRKHPEANLSFDELISMHMILAPAYLYAALQEAEKYLRQQRGTHKRERNQSAGAWFEPWYRILDEVKNRKTGEAMVPSSQIVTLAEMRKEMINYALKNIGNPDDNKRRTGVLFMATGEGAPGHISAWGQMESRVGLYGLLFESGAYFERNPGRRRPFLPEAMRASMAIYMSKEALVTRVPDKPVGEDESWFYKRIFNATGALISFVTMGDPHESEKANRGSFPDLAVLTREITQQTSERTQKLIEESWEVENPWDRTVLWDESNPNSAADSYWPDKEMYWGQTSK